MNLDDPWSILLHLGIVVAAIAFGFFFWQAHKRRLQAWRDFADRHGWGFTDSMASYKVGGLHRGMPFSMHTEHRRSGKSSQLYTVVRLELGTALPPDLRIGPEGFGDKLLKVFGKRDDEVGDAELDAALDMKNLTDEARDTLRAPRVREQLLLLRQRCANFSIENEELQAEQRGMPDSVDTLESLVAPALDLGDALQEATSKARTRRSGEGAPW
ncbi:hypothetical protein [Myxococcus xanthus]|uniref:hypothetical protein n=1 Tax=Myxococcus xanthus TaxID=34 RepID=UPI00112C02E6|nr:hypothetical protein [Myxococcus xanthus]QDE81883.1 hypothetical protein BHS07_10170 [Myxococcus xanthus]